MSVVIEDQREWKAFRRTARRYERELRRIRNATLLNADSLRQIAAKALTKKRRKRKISTEGGMTWHRDFPDSGDPMWQWTMWEVVAKALMIREGGVALTAHELREAAATQAEIQMDNDGAIMLRVAQN